MDKRRILSIILWSFCLPALITIILYVLNSIIFRSSEIFSPIEAVFLEGVGLLSIGIMLLLGRGGMNTASLRAAILSATTEAVSGSETVSPSEIMRQDAWKAKGFKRAGFILIISGIFMLVVYFINIIIIYE